MSRSECILTESILHYSLDNGQLALSFSTGILSLLEQGRIVRHYMLSLSEMRVLYALVEASPVCCTHEKLLASYRTTVPLTGKSIQECSDLLSQPGKRKKLLKPLYNVVKKLRRILQATGVDIVPLVRYGYRLVLFEGERQIGVSGGTYNYDHDKGSLA